MTEIGELLLLLDNHDPSESYTSRSAPGRFSGLEKPGTPCPRQPERASKHQSCDAGLGTPLSHILSYLGNALSTPAMLPDPQQLSGWTPLKQSKDA